MAESEPSLRESKRQATRAAIEDRASALAAEKGFDNVTVDDICAEVGISKRTFFNYVDSKETAVLGDPPRVPTEEERAEFLATEHKDILSALCHLAFELATTVRCVSPEQRAAVLRRRRVIRQRDPHLTYQNIAGVHTMAAALVELTEEYLELYPGRKTLPTSALHEAQVLVAIAACTLQLGNRVWLEQSDGSFEALEERCFDALHELTTIFQGRSL